MPITFNPERLTPTASLNRVRIVDLLGIALEQFVRGKTAYELLAAHTLAADVRHHADALNLPELAATPDREVLRIFAHCCTNEAARLRPTVDAITYRFGHALGALILTLKRGDVINRQARPDWDHTYWAYWSGIDTIWLGGGLANDPLSASICHHAQALLREDATHACELRVAAHPSFLPLIGAARGLPPATRAALIFDFGQSVIKRALARYDQGDLTSLHVLPPLPAAATFSTSDDLLIEQVHELAAWMVNVLIATWQDVRSTQHALVPLLVVSIASYEVDGQPLPRQGGPYAQLHRLSPNLARWLADQVSHRLSRPFDVVLIHDGTSAARTYAGAGSTATIMLGTALGVGFSPRELGLRPIAAGFTLQDEESAYYDLEPADESS